MLQSTAAVSESGSRSMESNAATSKWYYRAAALWIGAVLVRSSVSHLENSYAFLASIYAYDLVGSRVGVVLAMLIPSIQLTLGLMLILFPKLRRFSLNWCVVLFGSFTVVQLITLARGLNIDCGCFGSSLQNPIGWGSIMFAAALCATSLVGSAGLLEAGRETVSVQVVQRNAKSGNSLFPQH